MLATMPERPRITFDCSEKLALAIRLRLAKTGEDRSQFFEAALSQELAVELQEAERWLKEGGAVKKSNRGRKPGKPPA